MKNNSVLINTARGVLVDENALFQEIKIEELLLHLMSFGKNHIMVN